VWIHAYRLGHARALVALRVFLRLTAMDVCRGPPTLRSFFQASSFCFAQIHKGEVYLYPRATHCAPTCHVGVDHFRQPARRGRELFQREPNYSARSQLRTV
jgi:hypothetical protein